VMIYGWTGDNGDPDNWLAGLLLRSQPRRVRSEPVHQRHRF